MSTPGQNKVVSLGRERGVYLVLFALMLVFLLLFSGLVLTTGFLSVGAARFEQVSNLVSLAALEGFMQLQDPNATYGQKTANALNRANQIFALNHLPGFRDDFGGIDLAPAVGEGGTLTFGSWHRDNLPDGTNPCEGGETPPCFVPNQGGALTANAVRAELTNRSDNPLELPFCKLFNSCEKGLRVVSYATLVQRCTAFLIDLSASTYFTTHRFRFEEVNIPNPLPPKCEGVAGNSDNIKKCLRDSTTGALIDTALPFYLYSPSALTINSATYDQFLSNCDTDVPYYTVLPINWQQVLWCNMARDALNNYSTQRPATETVNPTMHYASDYKLRTFRNGGQAFNLMVDSLVADDYDGPEPYTSFFHAFNAALRVMKQQGAAGDMAMIKGFTGDVRAEYPATNSNPNAPKMLQDLGPLIQITNLSNRGTFAKDGTPLTPEIRPNILDYGFYWTFNADPLGEGTNPVLALNVAMDALINECPSSAMRTIVMASDGVATCYASGPSPYDSLDKNDYVCPPSFDESTYLEASNQILNGVLPRLISNQISVVGLLAGDHVDPHFMNPGYDDPDTPDGPRPLAPSEAYAHGVPWGDIFEEHNSCPGPDPSLGVWVCHTDPDTIIRRLGVPGYKFRKPVGMMGQLSLRTGGAFCPLMPKCGPGALPPPAQWDSTDRCGYPSQPSCYIPDPSNPSGPEILNPALRTPEDYGQHCSLYNLTMAEQAAKCVMDFLGGNPYVLVTPER